MHDDSLRFDAQGQRLNHGIVDGYTRPQISAQDVRILRGVPTISSFYGILVVMFFDDHPPPHVHVRYAEFEARVSIVTGAVISGALPPRGARMMREWVNLRAEELAACWRRAEAGMAPGRVEPLP